MAVKSSVWKKVGIAAVVLIVFLTIAKSAGWLGNSDAVKVSTEKVMRRDIIEMVSANGKVQPEVELKISADVSGEITELNVKEGDVVKKGMLLCRINPEIYVSSLDQATASVNGSRANFENSKSRLTQAMSQMNKSNLTYTRNRKLFDEGAISASDMESIQSAWEVAKAEADAARQSVAAAEFNVKSAEAQLKSAKENLNKTSIYAPVDGTISKLSKEKGERVVGTNMMEGTEIMRIANLNEMEVSVDVSENDIVRVSKGDTTDIDIDAWTGRKFLGVVTEVANSANLTASVSVTDQVTNFTVKIRILRESYTDLLEGKAAEYSPFRPGMSATVDIRTKKSPNVLTLPIQAVTTRDTVKKDDKADGPKDDSKSTTAAKPVVKEFVFVVNEGKAKMIPVKSGIQDNMYIEIKEGVKEGQEVIVAPYNAVSRDLKEGTVVKIVPKDQLFAKEKGK